MLAGAVARPRIIAGVEAWSAFWVGVLVAGGNWILDGGHMAVSTLIVTPERHGDRWWVSAAILDGRKTPSELTSMRVTTLLETRDGFD